MGDTLEDKSEIRRKSSRRCDTTSFLSIAETSLSGGLLDD